ncbi:MAG: hypothetical protein JNK34_01440 [Tabrizicola sp.]|nr:hypothetical protein [Tabrizicola sp.]
MRAAIPLLALTGCVPATTPEGCTIYATPIMQAHTDGCVQAYYEEKARQSGGQITRCFPSGSGTTCITE